MLCDKFLRLLNTRLARWQVEMVIAGEAARHLHQLVTSEGQVDSALPVGISACDVALAFFLAQTTR